jgi:hypothetical protein
VVLPSPRPFGANPVFPSTKGDKTTNLWKIDVSTFEQPQWWDDLFGWLAFYDKNVLSSSSALFRGLRYSKTQFVYQEGTGYMQPPSQKDDWLLLDNQLKHACLNLITHYNLVGFAPINPWCLGYLRPHKKRGTLFFCLEKSRQWFSVWMALLSYLIAASQSVEARYSEYPTMARLHWQNLLADKGESVNIDCGWIDMLLDSTVASFSPAVSRAGTFVRLGRENSFDPQIDWFVEFGVPVWYEWTNEHVSRFGRFAPLEYQLQEVLTIVHSSPSPPSPPPPSSPTCTTRETDFGFDRVSSSGTPLTSHGLSSTPASPRADPYAMPPISMVQMDTFFRLRDARIARLLERETPQQRSARLSREAQPPTKNARVFEWRNNGSGEYVSEEVCKKDRQSTLDFYSGDQSRYNAVLNEWHVCELWGEYPDDDDYFPTYEGDDRSADDAVAPTSSDLHFDEAPVEDLLLPAPAPSEGDVPKHVNRRALQLEGEILTIASLYLGYTPCVPLPTVDTLNDEKKRKSFCRCFGLIWNQVQTAQEAFAFPSVAAVIDFFYRLASNSNIQANEWDLVKDNPHPIVLSPRFQQFRPIYSTIKARDERGMPQTKRLVLYMLDLGPTSSAPWKLAVKSAQDALMICRLDSNFDEYNIVEFLLTNGIPFHTLQPSTTVSRTPNVHHTNIRPLTRPEGYSFHRRDYTAYRKHCHAILDHPRGRAALMHGHFIWRLAMRSVRWEAVYGGPSGSPNPDEMLIATDPSTNMEYVDDKLSEDEQAALCGTYHCFTGKIKNNIQTLGPR